MFLNSEFYILCICDIFSAKMVVMTTYVQ